MRSIGRTSVAGDDIPAGLPRHHVRRAAVAGCQGSERMKTIARFGALAVLAMAVLAFTSVGSATAPATTEERTTEVVLASFESGVIPTGVASSSDDLNCSDAAAMIRRLGTAIRDMESKLQDLK